MITYQYALFICLAIFLLGSCQQSANTDAEEIVATTHDKKTFDIHRGVNISHWLSQSRTRGEKRRNYFTERDVQAVAEAGFDHIRIPIDEEQMWDKEGNKEEEAFELLHQALGWMDQHHLKALVDLHIIRAHHFLDDDPPLFTDPAEQEKFANLWVQLSEELRKYPNEEVAYELLNESVAKDHNDWNKVYKLAYDKVREKEPERVIFIGPNRWQNVRYFPYLDIPENDPNIVLSFHFYIPHIITHYTASWTDIKEYEGPIHYPGVLIDPADTLDLPEAIRAEVRQYAGQYMSIKQLEELMEIGIAKADSLGLQLYCGEFGCLNTIPGDMRNRWFSDMITLLEKYDIAWSAWDLKSGGFGMFDPEDYGLMIPEEILFIGEE